MQRATISVKRAVQDSRFWAAAIAVVLVAVAVAVTGASRASAQAPDDAGLRVAILGDSYISGEGTGHFISGTDISSNRCHRSVRSWAYMTGAVLADGDTNDIAFFACSGATTDDMWNANGSSHGNERAQLEAFEAAHRQNPFDVVFVSIGGNDAGFGDVALACVTTNCRGDSSYTSRLDTEVTPLVMQVLQRLRAVTGSQVPIFHMGYPDPLRPAGSCFGLLGISQAEQAWLSNVYVATLNSELARAARQAGVNFVDSSSWFDGHSICPPSGAERFANGLRLFSQSDSLHPTRAGYREMQRRFALSHMEGSELATASNPAPNDRGVRFAQTCAGVPATFLGTAASDPIIATAGPDVIVALGGPDVVYGRGGDDLICLGPGDDWVAGGPGADQIWGGPGSDNISGGRGADSIRPNSGNDIVRGSHGNDRIRGGGGRDRLLGGPGDDHLWGQFGRDRLSGGAGTDSCIGGAHIDQIEACEP
ncbi:MAG: GDSL-type esterase/lipase family protein [Acidimicrobiales bacterium]